MSADNDRCDCDACRERSRLHRDRNLRAGEHGIVSPSQLMREAEDERRGEQRK